VAPAAGATALPSAPLLLPAGGPRLPYNLLQQQQQQGVMPKAALPLQTNGVGYPNTPLQLGQQGQQYDEQSYYQLHLQLHQQQHQSQQQQQTHQQQQSRQQW
jgi:hypothetical protein